jgi:hypothetical protein
MDGLPAMKKGLEFGRHEKVEPIKKMVGPLAPKNNMRGASSGGFALETTAAIALVSFILGLLLALYGQDILAFSPSRTLALPFVDRRTFSFGSLPSLGA